MQTTALTSGPLRAGRAIVTRTAGRQHGAVKRLVSPSDLGEVLKPFVFLDYFDSSVEANMRFSMHPHSGLATTTVLLEGEVEYEDTTGASGIMPAGSVEWMNAARWSRPRRWTGARLSTVGRVAARDRTRRAP
jgi:redox-sensitive bicupin YhaK (pirin superfamily)